MDRGFFLLLIFSFLDAIVLPFRLAAIRRYLLMLYILLEALDRMLIKLSIHGPASPAIRTVNTLFTLRAGDGV
jgi:hypothetical protein